MADSYIRVADDGTGKKMQTVKNTVGSDEVHAEVVTLADTTGTAITALPVTDNSGSLTVDGTVTGRIVGNAGAVIDATVAAGTAPASGVATLVQYKNTQPAPSDTQTMIPQADQAGNSRITYGAATATLSTWNSSTALNSTQTIYSNSGVTAATVMLQQSAGTFSAGAITFEVSFDGTNFVTAPSSAVADPSDTTLALISLPYTLVTSTNKPFLLINSGWQALRIKLSTAITGTGTVIPVYTLLPEAPGRPVTLISGPSGNKVDLTRVNGNTATTSGNGRLEVRIVGTTGRTIEVNNGIQSSIAQNAVAVAGMISKFDGSALSGSDQGSSPFWVDTGGNMRVSPGMLTLPTQTWNTATSLNTTSTIFTNSGVPAVVVNTVANAGTFTAGAVTFEASFDGSAWSTVPADVVMDASSTSIAQVAVPYTIVASTTKNFLIINRGWQGLRIKLSTAITGSSSPTLTIIPAHISYAPLAIVGQNFIGGTAIATNAGNASAGTQRVVIASDQAQVATKEARAATPTQSSVANNTGSVTLLSANSSRLGATIFNDDTAGTGATLKVKLGATASATSFTVAIAPQGYYEVPFNYTGIIDGIASAGTGNARITEIVA